MPGWLRNWLRQVGIPPLHASHGPLGKLRRERGVVGDTPNLAARLQAIAEPDTVVISESTRRLLGRTFELKALGPQDLKGFKTPVSVWSIVRERESMRFAQRISGRL